MNAENNQYNDLQNAYLDYYQGQLKKAERICIYLLLIAVLNIVSSASINIVPDKLQCLPIIAFIICSLILTVYILYLLLIRIKNLFYIVVYISVIISVYIGISPVLGQPIDALTYTLTFATILLGGMYRSSEKYSSNDAEDVVQYIKPHISEDHTAVILKHNANRAMDDGDKNVLPLIKVLNKYGEDFQIYLCLYEDNMVKVLTNPHAKRFWIFGHGKKGCLRMTDKLFSYENFMKEHGTELHDIDTIEYVYQCHCNRGTAKPLTDCLLKERKGLLDPNVDSMPNYYDSGLANMELDKSIKSKCRLRFAVWVCSFLGEKLHIDLNYNSPSSVEHIIKRYEAHLERKAN